MAAIVGNWFWTRARMSTSVISVESIVPSPKSTLSAIRGPAAAIRRNVKPILTLASVRIAMAVAAISGRPSSLYVSDCWIVQARTRCWNQVSDSSCACDLKDISTAHIFDETETVISGYAKRTGIGRSPYADIDIACGVGYERVDTST